MSKYYNRKCELDGIRFDSIKEMNHYAELKVLEKGGVIKDLKLQPEYILVPAYIDNGKKVRPIIYRADFAYTENGKSVVEDVKGFKTDVYKLKKKIFRYMYPAIDFREI